MGNNNHWDGKIISDLTGREKVNRLPIMVSGDGMYKILAVPKLSDRKARATAEVIGGVLTEWDLKNRVVTLCFDPTAVNTGAKSGICIRLDMMLGRSLVYFALVLRQLRSCCPPHGPCTPERTGV